MGPKSRGVSFWFLPFVFLSSFLVYLLTLNPAFQPDDSAETIAACVTLAPQHPSGYPLHSLLGHLFSFVPIGSPTFRLNLLAALLGSFLVSLVALYLWRAVLSWMPTKGKGDGMVPLLAAYGGAMALAFSKTYWLQCLSAKGGIYLLESLFFLGLVLGLERMAETKDRSKAFLALGAWVGLGAATGLEMFFLLMVAFLVPWSLAGSGRKPEWNRKHLLRALSLVIVGTSLYLFLPLRFPGHVPTLVWGSPRTLGGFMDYLANRDIRHEMAAQLTLKGMDWRAAWGQVQLLIPQWLRVSNHLLAGLGLLAFLPLMAGFLQAHRKKRDLLLAAGSILALELILVNGLFFYWPEQNLWSIDKFFLPFDLFGAICVGIGIQWIGERLAPSGGSKGHPWRKVVLVAVVALGLPVLSLTAQWKELDQSHQTFAYDLGTDLLRSLKKDAVFVAEGDHPLFSIDLFQEALGLRKDVTLVPAYYLWNGWAEEPLERKFPGLSFQHPGPPTPGQLVQGEMTRIAGWVQGRRALQVSANLDLLDRCYFSLLPTVQRSGDLFNVLTPYGFTFLSGKDAAGEGFGLLDHPRERGRVAASPGGAMDAILNLRAQAYLNAAVYWDERHSPGLAERYDLEALDRARAPGLLAPIWSERRRLLLERR